MTESGWLRATSVAGGLWYLCNAPVNAHRRKAGRRKLRLFLCACCRCVWDLMPRGPYRKAVQLGERMCEEEDVAKELAALGIDPWPHLSMEVALHLRHAAGAALLSVQTELAHAANAGSEAAAWAAGWWKHHAEDIKVVHKTADAERLAQVALLHDIFGNPFRPAKKAVPQRCRNDRTVQSMARTIYFKKRFADLPILADALEDAGCDNARMLAHCRGPVPHVRGCWVIDLLLGKE